jgi:O-antigen ligase
LSPVAPLAALMLLLPFEPLAPLTRVFGLEASHLETAALVLLGAAAAGIALRRPKLRIPLAVPVLSFLAVFLASAILASGSALLPLKFTARMAAAAAAFYIASEALTVVPRFSLLFSGLSIAGTITAAIALLEAGPLPFDDALLAPFREHAFEVGGRTRAAATFAYPNTAGGFLTLALAPTLYFTLRERTRTIASIAACAIVAAILLTYSRGALLGAAASCIVMWWLVRSLPLLRLEAGLLMIVLAFFAIEPSFRWRASSEGDRSWYQARIEPRRTSLQLEPSELSKTAVRVANVGKLTWGSKGRKPFHLSYRWFELSSPSEVRPLAIEGERTRLDAPLKPGESLDVDATVRAPRQPGIYVLIWDMVHEHTTWFSDKVGLGTPVNVLVGDAVAPATVPDDIRRAIAEKSWRPGRRELWAIAVRLFASHPLLGVGPDNFRWLYGPASGHAIWDTRIFSNSLYLELLATVGLLGFGAFALLMGRALDGLRRCARVGKSYSLEAASVAASLTGFLVHGLFDYLLAFTAIYLAIFVLLGASSALIQKEASP